MQKHLDAPGRDALERMWESHRESVRRLLLGLARDLDLADDLLQDTYLRARAGISSYRGGDARAWLAAVARSAFYTHARKRHLRAEVPLSEHEPRSEDATHDRVELLAVRQAIAELAPALRTALLMKHYAGFTYREIAGHTGCPIGTAKWRVSEALGALRTALRAERRMAMAECTGPDDTSMVDYVYGVLPETEAATMKAHLGKCASCREQVEELNRVVSLLDAVEGDYRQMQLLELDRDGGLTVYCAWSQMNDQDRPLDTAEFQSDNDARTERLYQEGDEIEFTVAPHPEFGNLQYTATLHRPVAPGGRLSLLSSASFPVTHRGAAKQLGDGRFRFQRRHSPSSSTECAYAQALRLPPGAKLALAEPEPDEVRGHGTTTLVWRRVLPPARFFECTVEYALPESAG